MKRQTSGHSGSIKKLKSSESPTDSSSPSDNFEPEYFVEYNTKLGNEALLSKNYTKAIKHYEEALLLSLGNVPLIKNLAKAHTKFGEAYLASKNYDQAIEQLEKASRLAPENGFLNRKLAKAHTKFGEAYLVSKDYDRAIEQFKVASLDTGMKKYKGLAKAHYKLGEAHLASKDYDRAIEQLEESLKIKTAQKLPTVSTSKLLATAHDELGKNYLASKDYDHAIEQLEKALKIKTVQNLPKLSTSKLLATAHNESGKDHLVLKEYDRAIEQFKAALKLDNDPDIIDNLAKGYYEKATICYNSHDFQQAIVELNEGLKVRPDTKPFIVNLAKAYNGWGVTYLNSKNYESAIEQFKKASELANNPKNTLYLIYAYNEAGNAALSQSDARLALSHYTKCVELMSIDAPISDRIIDLLINIVYFIESQATDTPGMHQRLQSTQYKNLEQILIIQKGKIGAISPDDTVNLSSAHHKIAETYLKLSKYDTHKTLEYRTKSIEHFATSNTVEALEKIIEIDLVEEFVSKEKIYSRIGDLYVMQDNSLKALDYFLKVFAITPKDLEVNLKLSNTYKTLGDHDKYMEYLSLAQPPVEDNPEIVNVLGAEWTDDGSY